MAARLVRTAQKTNQSDWAPVWPVRRATSGLPLPFDEVCVQCVYPEFAVYRQGTPAPDRRHLNSEACVDAADAGFPGAGAMNVWCDARRGGGWVFGSFLV